MAKKFEDLAETVLRDLKDSNSSFWSVAEINEYLNEGQLRYSEETEILRRVSPITNKENREVYRFPDGMIKLKRAENQLKNELILTDSNLLSKQYGNFRDSVGTPSYLYSDLDGPDKFRLHPRPEPSIEDGGNPVSCHEYAEVDITLINSDSTLKGSIAVKDGELYTVNDGFIIIYHNDLTERAKHVYTVDPLTVDTAIAVSPIGIFFVSHGTAVAKFTAAGSESAFLTAGSAVVNMAEIGISSTKVMYSSTTTTYESAIASAFEVTALVFRTWQYSWDEINEVYWLATRSNGLWLRTQTGTSTQHSADDTAGVVVMGAVLYVNKLGTLVHYDPVAAVFTATTVTTLRNDTPLHRASNSGIYANDSNGDLVLIAASGTTASISKTWTDLGEVNNLIVETTSVLNGNIVNLDRASTTTHGIRTSENEAGAMVYADGDAFDQDEGAVIDSMDPDDTVTFNGEEGAIISGFEEAEQGKLFYSREPVEDLLEIKDFQALIEYAKFRALEKTGDREGLPKGSYFFAKYNDRVRKGKRLVSKGSNNNPRGASAHYY